MAKNVLRQKIGIVGGGQLGKMMLLEAKKMGFSAVILDPTPNCPAHSLCDHHIVAGFNDEAALRQLAEMSDVVTYEFEHIGVPVLMALEKEGHKIYPTPQSLQIIQNKFTQKTQMLENGLPVPAFMAVGQPPDLAAAGEKFGYPFILKSCTGGYDGKGNFVVASPEEINAAYSALGGGKLPLMAEKMVDFQMEISVLACRGQDGETAVYPVGMNTHNNNILDETIVPAPLSQETTKAAMALAARVMDIFQGVGMFCVELFVDTDGNTLINEVAPRPHNSGHYSIEACITSQFEQHIRAVAGLPLGRTTLLRPVAMANILGEEDCQGRALVQGLDKALALENLKFHFYGKEKTAPRRKMGHVTALGDTTEEALSIARQAKKMIRITAEE